MSKYKGDGMYSRETDAVLAKIPENIARIGEIAYNFWFAWNKAARELFIRINPQLWEDVYHNPVKFLLKVKQDELNKAAMEAEYLQLYQQVLDRFDAYMTEEKWYHSRYPGHVGQMIAYFSAEFGLHESLPVYSGGLGILAGDHLKAASDLGIPLVGVGLLYRHGYFTQRINAEGRQEVEYPYLHFNEMPLKPALGPDGKELTITVEMPGRLVHVKVWLVKVGRVSLYLLDTDTGRNCRVDRDITAQLYGGNKDSRIAQEIILGMGGVKVLRALNISPYLWHINEGHAAFLCLERMKEKLQMGIALPVVIGAIRANTLFTTHTPVPAGHDVYVAEMMEHYFQSFYRELGLSQEEFLGLGWDQGRQLFNMTFLAMHFAEYINGVSKLHGAVSRNMFKQFFQVASSEEVAIFHVTNGVHTESMMAEEMKDLFKRYLSSQWFKCISQGELWEGVAHIPDEELWAVHMNLKRKTVQFIRQRLKMQRIRNYETAERVAEVEQFLNPDVLTIGFARRFATYKRGALIFRDLERLSRLVHDPTRPLQIVFAGKAHPADYPGQELIKKISDLAAMDDFKGKIIFLENYDIQVARHLVQGVDVWLNTPRRPQEASGTSGMKAALNGVLHCSVLDGWWPEAFCHDNGFVIGEDKEYSNDELQDAEDSESLYRVLEEQIIPLYYQREAMGENEPIPPGLAARDIPRQWLQYMKRAIKTIVPYFSAERMVKEYASHYVSGIARGMRFREENLIVATRLKALEEFLQNNWHQVYVSSVIMGNETHFGSGNTMDVEAVVYLGDIWYQDVMVEIVYGEMRNNCLHDVRAMSMHMVKSLETGSYLYQGTIVLPKGPLGYRIRVKPSSADFPHQLELPLIALSRGQ